MLRFNAAGKGVQGRFNVQFRAFFRDVASCLTSDRGRAFMVCGAGTRKRNYSLVPYLGYPGILRIEIHDR